jgi:hypothetical protein
MEGQAARLWETLAAEGWLAIFPLHLVTLADIDLPEDSNDRTVWRFCQENQMILLTGNRQMKGENSLEQTLREEKTETSLPVLTIGNLDRMSEREYREACAIRLMEIVFDLENCLGVSRLYIP